MLRQSLLRYGLLAMMMMSTLSGCQRLAPIGSGATAPPLKAMGWTNGPAPSDLGGKVVVLEVFATW